MRINAGKLNAGNGAIASLVWKFAERMAAQLISTLVSILLARLLMPEDYGVVSVVMLLITFCNTFVTGGLGNALVQKPTADDTDFSSMFYVSLVLSAVIYAAIFFLAPLMAVFYENEMLVPLIRVMGLRIPFAAVNCIQQAFLTRRMQFKKFFVATLYGTVASAVVGIAMAYWGFGPWALVGQYLTNVVISTVVLAFVSGWRLRWLFDGHRVRQMLPFGLKMMAVSVIDTAFNEIRSVVISAKYSTVDLAVYENGRKFPNLLVTNVNTSIGSVIFPLMSKAQDDIAAVKDLMRRAIRLSTFLLAPLLIGFLVVSDRFVDAVLTAKWSECVPYIQITCIMCLFYPIHTINTQALNAVGHSGKTLKLEIVKKILNILILLISLSFGVIGIALGAMMVSLLSTWINAFYSRAMFRYSCWSQLGDIFPSLAMATVMAGAVYLLDRALTVNSWLALLLDVAVGIAIYVLACVVTKNREFAFLLQRMKALKPKGDN